MGATASKDTTITGTSTTQNKSELFTNLGQFQTILSEFNQSDPEFITKYIKTYNDSVGNNSALKIDGTFLNGPLVKRINRNHNLLVSTFTNANNAPTEETLDKPINPETKTKIPVNPQEFIDNLTKKETILLQNQTTKLLEGTSITEGAKTTLSSIVGTIASMKSRYSYFEYKYVQMNILLLVVIQNMYKTVIESITGIINLYNEQTEIRNKQLEEILTKININLKDSGLSIDHNNFSQLTQLITAVKQKSEDDANKLNNLVKDSKIQILGHIQGLGAGTGTSGLGTGTSGLGTAGGGAPNKKNMKGGFVRGTSTFPAQEFFNL
jgi:hypothetical protein